MTTARFTRTVRLLAVSAASSGEAEAIYVVASDETMWMGVWEKMRLSWRQLPPLPSDEVAL